MNLFKKIWLKNFKKGESPSKLADDLGPLKGVFRYQEFRNGKFVREETCENTIVNQSKSTIIRLISQGQTPWVNAAVPGNFRISKMRFSNDLTTSSIYNLQAFRKLEYYQLNEVSSRNVKVVTTDSNNTIIVPEEGGGAGGRMDLNFFGGAYTDAADPNAMMVKQNIPNTQSTAGYTLIDGKKSFVVADTINPPSHGTLSIIFYKTVGANNYPIEKISFFNVQNPSELTKYPRSTIPVVAIENYDLSVIAPSIVLHAVGGQTKFRFVCDADNRALLSTPEADSYGTILARVMNDVTAASSFYYDNNPTRENPWRFLLEEYAHDEGVDLWDHMTIKYEIGKFNIINTIIPATGINNGIGVTTLERYGTGISDYYSVGNSFNYADAASDVIDDYAVTFKIEMDAAKGNGNVGTDQVIQYRKAYLCTERDDIFSSILFLPFDKDPNANFVIYWTIKAPID